MFKERIDRTRDKFIRHNYNPADVLIDNSRQIEKIEKDKTQEVFNKEDKK